LIETSTAREITVTRIYDAPRELVWRAWTEPEQLARWWGKRGWTAQPSTIAMDVRPGGRFCVTTVCDEDGREMTNEAVYHEVVAPQRLRFGAASVTLSDLGDGRTEMVFHTTIESPEPAIRDAAAGGLASAFDRLAEILEESR